MELYKWSGAGNTFVVIDGRQQADEAVASERRATIGNVRGRGPGASDIQQICREYGTDGLMILRDSAAGHDFAMEFYNPDGSSGMMCGNGGRCIAAFAASLGIEPRKDGRAAGDSGREAGYAFVFDAPDGVHSAEILRRPGPESGGWGEWTVRLRMKDVNGITEFPDGLFLNTGTRHFVKFVHDIDALDIEAEALPIRHDPRFAPEGTNVNFVEIVGCGQDEPFAEDFCKGSVRGGSGGDGCCRTAEDGNASVKIRIRTFEKGVEGETAACGTGITAVALACRFKGVEPNGTTNSFISEGLNDGFKVPDGRIRYLIQAREALLGVDFLQTGEESFSDIFLTGPAKRT